jgi:hypothetical protein
VKRRKREDGLQDTSHVGWNEGSVVFGRLNERVGIAKKSAWKERRMEELTRGDEIERWKGVERAR